MHINPNPFNPFRLRTPRENKYRRPHYGAQAAERNLRRLRRLPVEAREAEQKRWTTPEARAEARADAPAD